MSSIQEPAIPKSSMVLVTGANGYIGSHIADKFLQFGYRVRGTVRDPARHEWIVKLFDEKYGNQKFELVAVKDIAADGAFDEAVKGVGVVVHVATINNFSPDPREVIPSTVAGALGALKAASREPSVTRFILTSSGSASHMSSLDKEIIVDENTWNTFAVDQAWKDPPYEPSRGYITYCASKTQGEQEVWKWYWENKPDLVVNTVVPCANFGTVLDPDHQGYPSSASWIANLYNGNNIDQMKWFPPHWFVDVEDDALLHVAAAIIPNVKNERIYAYAETFNFDQILDILRHIYPERTFVDDFHSGKDLTRVPPRDRAESLLKELGHPGWTSLEESVRKTLQR